MSHETTNPLVVVVDWLVEEERVARQLQELEKGEINIVQLNCLSFNELVHIQNIRVREVGGRIDQWTVQGEFNLVGDIWRWIVDAEEITTDWDTLDTCTDGDPTSLVNYDKEAGVTDGGEYIQATTESQLVAGYLWWSNYSVEMDVYVATGAAGDQGEVLIRKQSLSSSNTLFYRLLVDIDDDEVRFEYIDNTPTTTVLRTWNYTLAAATYYKLLIIARGNRFDCFIRGEYLGTVFDERLQCGYYGLMATSDTCRFDNLTIKHAKPVVAHLPVGVYDINQIQMPPTARLNDDVCADGLSQTVVAPINPIEFKQWKNQLNGSNVVLDLPLDEGLGDVTYDHSGNDNHGTITNAIWDNEYINERVQRVVRFDGDGDYIDCGDADEFSFEGDRPFSVEAIFKYQYTGTSQVIVGKSNATGSNIEWLLYISSTDYLTFWCCNYNSYGNRIGIRVLVTPDTLYHVIATYDGSKTEGGMTLYLNGVEVSTVSGSAGSYTGMTDGTASLMLGVYEGGTSGDFRGIISSVRLIREEYEASQVSLVYDQLQLNSSSGGEVKIWDTMGEDGYWDYLEFHAKLDEGVGGSLYDSSKYNRAVTETGIDGTEWELSSYCKFAKTCLHLDGAADRFYGALGGEILSSMTIGCWLDVDSLAAIRGIWASYDTSTSLWNTGLYVNTDGSLWFNIRNTANTSYVWGTATGVISTGQWYFIIVTWTGNLSDDPIIYVDGEALTWSTTDTPTGTMNDMDRIYFGYNGANYFDGYMDDTFYLSTDLPATYITWLCNNMPNMVDESQWERVLDIDHPFVGDMIIDNGKIRLCYGHRLINGDAAYWDVNAPYIYGYSDGIWERDYQFWPMIYTTAWLEEHYPLQIKEIKKNKVILEGGMFEGDQWIIFEYYITQSPMVMIKCTDWKLDANAYLYVYTKRSMENGVVGPAHAPRFSTPSLDVMCDSLVNGNTSGGETEGLSIAFSKVYNLLVLYFDEDNGNWHTYSYSGNDIASMLNATAIDFDMDRPPHWWGIGLIPFETNRLQWQQNSTSDGDEWTFISGSTAKADALASGGYYVALDTNNDGARRFFMGNSYGGDLPTGAYRIYYRAGDDTAASNDFRAFVYNNTDGVTLADSGSFTVATTYTWYYLDFVISSDDIGDDIYFQCEKETINITEIRVDEAVIWPISNSKNFPLDVRNQALMIPVITELGGKL